MIIIKILIKIIESMTDEQNYQKQWKQNKIIKTTKNMTNK